jgi:hypothetical protein
MSQTLNPGGNTPRAEAASALKFVLSLLRGELQSAAGIAVKGAAPGSKKQGEIPMEGIHVMPQRTGDGSRWM